MIQAIQGITISRPAGHFSQAALPQPSFHEPGAHSVHELCWPVKPLTQVQLEMFELALALKVLSGHGVQAWFPACVL